MGAAAGPLPGNIPTVDVPLALNGVGAALDCTQQWNKVLWIDSQGDGPGGPHTTVNGVWQAQVSVGGDEFTNFGTAISTFPGYVIIDERFTHVRLKCTTAPTLGVPRGLLAGNYD